MVILPCFNLLIGNWIIKIMCTFWGWVMLHVLKHWSLKIRKFLVLVVLSQVKVYATQPVSLV